MHHRCRSLLLSGAVLAALTTATAGCGSDWTASAEGSSASVTGQAPAGDAATTSASPDPTQVVTDSSVSTGPTTGATVFVTSSGWDAATGSVTVRGYLQGVVEDDGTCTLTLTRDGRSVTAERAGTSNVTQTSCGAVSVPRSQLATGTWTAVLSYRSSTSNGSSEPVEVDVP